MVFWISILVGMIFLWLALKLSFYETWIMFFNIVISIYIALFLQPVITNFLPVAGDNPYSAALTIVGTAIACFLILQGLAFVFFTSQFTITFPKIFEVLVSGFLGFLGGFLVCSFITLNIALTPLSEINIVKNLGFDVPSQESNISYLCWWCDHVHNVVSHADNKCTTRQLIGEIAGEIGKEEEGTPTKPVSKESSEASTSERSGTNLPEESSFF